MEDSKHRDIHQRKGLKKSQHILDYMDGEELGANIFRVTQTEAKLRREGVQGKQQANKAHFEVGREVRDHPNGWAARCPKTCRRLKRACSNYAEKEEKRLARAATFAY